MEDDEDGLWKLGCKDALLGNSASRPIMGTLLSIHRAKLLLSQTLESDAWFIISGVLLLSCFGVLVLSPKQIR